MIFRYGNFVIDQLEYFYALIPVAVFLFILLKKRYVKENIRLFKGKSKKRIIFILRIMFFAAIILAFAGPHFEVTQKQSNISKIKVLFDDSYSTQLYDFEEVEETLDVLSQEGITIDIERLDLKDYSTLGNSLLNSLAPEENILLVSDGQNNFGSSLEDVALFASTVNSRIFGIELDDKKDDARVIVEGPSKVVSGVDNTYTIKVEEVGGVGKKHLDVYVDDAKVYDGRYIKEINVKRRFGSGSHIIRAEIEVSEKDLFPENNVYYKTITVYPKPKVLFVSQDNSVLYELYSPFYSIDLTDDLDKDLDRYYAVVLNNIPAKELSDENIEKLENYVSDGNGLIVVGGKNSYDYGDYNKSLITTLLPVSIGKAQKKKDITNIMILMDTGSSGSDILVDEITHFDVQKSLAADVVRSISSTNKVGFMEANYYLNTLSGLSELGPKRQELITTIGLLKPEGFSELRFAYEKAYDVLRVSKGSRNILIITDGKLIPVDQALTLEYVERARRNSVKTFIIGVGDAAEEEFLKAVKELGDGEYFRADESSRIKMYFGDPGEIPPTDLKIFVYDSNHFITRELTELGRIYGFNDVYPKSTARLLLTTNNGEPILTTWNYGLGRVAALSTDDGSLWTPDLVGEINSKVLIRTLNWLIEDPERKNQFVIDIPELRLSENSVITIRSDEVPYSKDLSFIETDNSIYKANYYPNETGIIDLFSMEIAVNYKKEFLNLGIHHDFEKILEVTGGEILENDPKIINDKIQSLSKVETLKVIDVDWVFAVIALIIYLTEILIRRIYQLRQPK